MVMPIKYQIKKSFVLRVVVVVVVEEEETAEGLPVVRLPLVQAAGAPVLHAHLRQDHGRSQRSRVPTDKSSRRRSFIKDI